MLNIGELCKLEHLKFQITGLKDMLQILLLFKEMIQSAMALFCYCGQELVI